jgi:HAD superfamily hydrolase (TIGR01549 family)
MMSLTLLLDLDDTLLDSNMEILIPAYFRLLSEYLADQVDPNKMLPALMSGTRKMMDSIDHSKSLREVFDLEFYPSIGLLREQLYPTIEQFYKDIFPKLRDLTKPRPEAQAFVEWAFSQGFTVVIATNPLFPRAAIYHRMDWAGLPHDKYPFQIVSSYENFHFTKPRPEYFAEVIAQMGWPDGPILLVGDDLDNDIAGASKLGLATFWMPNGKSPPQENPGFLASGSFPELRQWLDRTDASRLEPAYHSTESLMAILRATPAAIQGILFECGVDIYRRKPHPEEWSLTEIICHLRDTEIEVNLERLATILEHTDPFLATQNTDSWAKERKYNKEDFPVALQQFASARLQTLKMLGSLTKAQWQRQARHAIFGPSTLFDIVNFMVEHDRLHIRQIIATFEQVHRP